VDGKEKIEVNFNVRYLYIMNKDDFKKLIEESIEKKIRDVLPKVLDEYFTSIKSEQKPKSVEKSIKKEVSERVVSPTSPEVKREKKTYVKDPVLNDILNETVVKIKQDGSGVVSGAPEKMASSSVLDKIDEVPPTVQTALTRDYSQLLKLSMTKSKNR
jgi:polyribonucleotide nucleotidyltransferase